MRYFLVSFAVSEDGGALDVPLGLVELDGLLGLGDIAPLFEVSGALVPDGAVLDGAGVAGTVVDDELEVAGGVVVEGVVDGDVVSVFWQPARAPSIRTTPSEAQDFDLIY